MRIVTILPACRARNPRTSNRLSAGPTMKDIQLIIESPSRRALSRPVIFTGHPFEGARRALFNTPL
jgi:hypothetical protein